MCFTCLAYYWRLDATYNLVIDYYDNNEKKQIVLASARTDSSKEEIERFMNNFYYKEDKNIKKKEVQSRIRFCM